MPCKRGLLWLLIIALTGCAPSQTPPPPSQSRASTVTPTATPTPAPDGEPPTATYLGETPPGPEPALFRPGSVSTGAIELSLAIHPHRQACYFTRLESGKATILVSRQSEAGWTTPAPASFSGEYDDVSPFISADGQRLYFASTRPPAGSATPSAQYHIWYVVATSDGWSNPTQLLLPLASVAGETSPTLTQDGTLYYMADYPALGGAGLYRARYADGAYQTPARLDVLTNTDAIVEVEPFVAPDGSFVLFYSAGRPDNLTPNGRTGDLYIAFQDSAGGWSAPQNLGALVNSEAEESTPTLSPDGQYLFFASNRGAGQRFPDLYWVATAFLSTLRPAAAGQAAQLPTPTVATPTAAPVVKSLRESIDFRTGKGPVYSQDWSPDGRWLVTADYDQVRVWDIEGRREAGVLAGHANFVWGLRWSPTGNVLASASQDGSVRLWDVAAYTPTAVLDTGWAFGVDWSPDGKRLAVGNRAGEVQIWDVATRQWLYRWRSATPAIVISVAWSPDGKVIASGEFDGDIVLWDVETGQTRSTLAGYTTARCDVNGLDWSPDGAILASAHQDGQVRLWNGATGELVRAIAAHTGWVRGIAWSPDGRFLASTGEDKRICLWNPETGQEYAEQHHNRLSVWSASWSPDGTQVASGGGAYEQPHVGATIVWTIP